MSVDVQEKQRYQIGGVLGRGGMATVYGAYDNAAEMDVALKVIHPHLADDEGMVEAFTREAALMQRIDHPGVLQVHGTTEVDGRPAIVMELCDGGDLSRRLARQESFGEEQALQIVIAVLDALQACHDMGIIHRDIKPHNVMFDADDRVKLIDFGIGQAEELMAAGDHGQVGTVEYMAPERVDEMAVDGRSDIYSVGIMLFELLCGHVPYRADSASEIIGMHRRAEVADPGVFVETISRPVAQAAMRAMAKHPEERFDRAQDMIDALRGQGPSHLALDHHPTWKALSEQFQGSSTMAAPIEHAHREWVIFVPRESLSQEIDFDRPIRSVLDDYDDYLDPRFKQDWSAPRDQGRQLLAAAGLARGLSRPGVDHLVERLDQSNIPARIARRPRHERDESGLRQKLTSMTTLRRAVATAFFLPFLVLNILGVMAIAGQPVEMVGLQSAALIVASLLAGVAVGWIRIRNWFPQWWLSRFSADYALDFCRHRRAEKADGQIDEIHFRVLDQIESPRISASYSRALNMALYIRDLVDQGSIRAVQPVIDHVLKLGQLVVDLEMNVAAIRPAELTSQIGRLDRQIEGAQDIEVTEALMTQRRSLREQLRRRDQDLQHLQTQAQNLHDIAAGLESLVQRHRRDRTDDHCHIVLDFQTVDSEVNAVLRRRD